MSELKAFELKVGKNLETDSPIVVGVDNKWNSRIMSCEEVYLKSEADKVIAEKDKEIEELKQKLESVDAGMRERERKLKRALYKACANWARFAVAFFGLYATKEKWYKMESKCLKKAEEYK